ncbi:nuclear cap-binding protein subunit 2 [Mycobacterium sp. E2733]|uniref:nuclear cap-binding protein subunit 2 n=1 Tax=Mycobacterium sp. E2733 TaxID=1834138 RepID=UPI000B06D7CB|nr:nuclear cap-binding protein subunit 2 [Mycobacterium sp. E2733]
MTQPTALLHHVVFAIGLERLDKAAEYLTAIGFCFHAFDHEELRLAIRLDWDRGFELISPLADAPTDAGTAADFLARHGDGSALRGSANPRLWRGRAHSDAIWRQV